MDERYLTSFEDKTSALGYTSGDTTLVSPQVSLIGDDEVVYSKEIPNESRIRFAQDETTGKLYFIVDGVYIDLTTLLYTTNIPATPTEYVDLGLSVKWAKCNVGASTPTENGAYFSWGNTNGVVFNTENINIEEAIRKYLRTIGKSDSQIEEALATIKETEGWEEMATTDLSNITFVDGYQFTSDYYANTEGGQYTGSTLDAEHDAATVNMGSEWRMPTSAETVELVKNTDHYYISEDGSIVDKSGLSSSKKLRSICFVKKGEAFDYNNRTNFIEFPFAGYCGINNTLSGFIGIVLPKYTGVSCRARACSAAFGRVLSMRTV